jgi:hypothetical protein
VTKGIKSPAWGRVQEKHFKSNNHWTKYASKYSTSMLQTNILWFPPVSQDIHVTESLQLFFNSLNSKTDMNDIGRFGSYPTVNKLRLSYENKSVNVLTVSGLCWIWDS